MFESNQKQIMAIWNVSSDSFSSEAESEDVSSCSYAQKISRQGADIIDIGAESTRPGAIPITPEEEMARLESPLSWARTVLPCPLSLDSRYPETIEWALNHDFVDIINDIGGTEDISESREGRIYRAVANANAAIILMAWFPHDARELPFDDCMKRIEDQLRKRRDFAIKCGMDPRKIVLDPGIGFGKGLFNDYRLISEAPAALAHLSCPVLIAHSRKRCIAKLAGCAGTTPQTLHMLDTATAMASLMAFQHGAAAVRVHSPALNVIARQMATYD